MIEMEERMQSMENMFTKRLMRVVSLLLFSFLSMFRSSAVQMEHNEERMDAKLDLIQRSRMLGRVTIPRSEGGYSDSIADSDVGPLRMSDHDMGENELDDVASSVAGVG